MSNPNECPKCSNGETSRTVKKLTCFFCGKLKPIEELTEGMCNNCYQRYKKNPYTFTRKYYKGEL